MSCPNAHELDKIGGVIQLRHRGIRHLEHRLAIDKAKHIGSDIPRPLEEAQLTKGKIGQLNQVDTQFKVPDEVVGSGASGEDIGSSAAIEGVEA